MEGSCLLPLMGMDNNQLAETATAASHRVYTLLSLGRKVGCVVGAGSSDQIPLLGGEKAKKNLPSFWVWIRVYELIIVIRVIESETKTYWQASRPSGSEPAGSSAHLRSRNRMKVVRAVILLLGITVSCTVAIPRRGNEPWTLILCKFADLAGYEPRSVGWFEEWLTGEDQDSIQNYFAQVSNGIYTINGSNVVGWITLPYTQKDVLRLANAEASAPIGSEASFEYYDKIKDVCVNTATELGHSLHRQKITVVNAGTSAVYGKKNGVLLTPQLMFSSVLTHEMVHSFFIGHSYSDRRIKIFPYAMHGEYDDRYDLQSTANAYMHNSVKFGMSGPGLNAAHLDFLGWLPMDRMLYFGRDGRQNYTLRLSSLSLPHNETRGWLMVMIPYDRNDPRNFYTVELRTRHRYDRGIAQHAILIHRVQRAGQSYYSVLISQSRDYYELTEGTEWVTFLEPDLFGNFQYVRVTVKKMYDQDADVTITSSFNSEACRLGELRKSVMDTSYGVDHVCQSRSQARFGLKESDLRRQFRYRNFFGLLATFGANECRDGFVWRAIDGYDFVCVPPHRQDAVQKEADAQANRLQFVTIENMDVENRNRESRAAISSDSGTPVMDTVPIQAECATPYVERMAFQGDVICVTPQEQTITAAENANAVNLLKHYEFFNGVDSVGP
uniref:DUF1570 domain-containing protein n=1 Tax=Panagrellus redivivus TaxID=6233 RepID=A0A7E5A228_PANRE